MYIFPKRHSFSPSAPSVVPPGTVRTSTWPMDSNAFRSDLPIMVSSTTGTRTSVCKHAE